MNIFLSGKYERRAELAQYATALKLMGHNITATWLDGEYEAKDKMHTKQEAAEWAERDFENISKCDIFLAFTGGEGSNRGGRHVELGFAKAKDKKCYAIGLREDNIFYADLLEFDSLIEWVCSNEYIAATHYTLGARIDNLVERIKEMSANSKKDDA